MPASSTASEREGLPSPRRSATLSYFLFQLPTLPSDERLRRDRRRAHRGDPRERERRERREREPKPKPVTEADVARTYTGLDRRIAEEFIMAMDHGRPTRQQPHDDTDSHKD